MTMRGAELYQLNMSKNLIVYKLFAIVNRQKCYIYIYIYMLYITESLNCSSSNKRGKHFSFIQWLSDKESACPWRGSGFDSWVRKIPWRRKYLTNRVFLPGKSHGQRSLVNYSTWIHKRIRQDLVTKQHRNTWQDNKGVSSLLATQIGGKLLM